MIATIKKINLDDVNQVLFNLGHRNKRYPNEFDFDLSKAIELEKEILKIDIDELKKINKIYNLYALDNRPPCYYDDQQKREFNQNIESNLNYKYVLNSYNGQLKDIMLDSRPCELTAYSCKLCFHLMFKLAGQETRADLMQDNYYISVLTIRKIIIRNDLERQILSS